MSESQQGPEICDVINCKLSFLFPPCCQSAPESLLAGKDYLDSLTRSLPRRSS